MRANKALGQHFLVHGPTVNRIVAAAQITPEDLVVEIGPGRGALTGLLVEQASRVVAVELDALFCTELNRRFAGTNRFELINRDVREVDFSALVRDAGWDRAILVGNLPYHITGELVRQITDSRAAWRWGVVMVQREVARRMVAMPGGKDYGVLSTVVQVRAEPEALFDVPPSHFHPPPKVHSSVLRLNFETQPRFQVADEAMFLKVVRTTFQQRRKMLRNTLRALTGGQDEVVRTALEAAGVCGDLRPEAISIDQFERICQALKPRI